MNKIHLEFINFALKNPNFNFKDYLETYKKFLKNEKEGLLNLLLKYFKDYPGFNCLHPSNILKSHNFVLSFATFLQVSR